MSISEVNKGYAGSPMSKLIPQHYTWDQLDSSKLTEYIGCPRKFFYRYVMGLVPDNVSVHLVAGAGIHKGLEHIAAHGPDESISNEDLADKAFELYLEEWRKTFMDFQDDLYKEKGPKNVRTMFHLYVQKRRHPEWTVQAIEIPGIGEIGPDRFITGRLDLVVNMKGSDAIAVVDHKTTTRLSSHYRDSWALNLQMGAYLHMLHSLYPSEQIHGAIIDCLILRKHPEPEYYKVGEKKGQMKPARTKGIEFERIPIYKNNKQMRDWLTTVNLHYDRIEQDFAKLQEPQGQTLNCFPMNPGNCTAYNSICPYHSFCQHSEPEDLTGDAPAGYKVEFWDPELHETVDANKKGSDE